MGFKRNRHRVKSSPEEKEVADEREMSPEPSLFHRNNETQLDWHGDHFKDSMDIDNAFELNYAYLWLKRSETITAIWNF